jgi:V-type H+-transporting ATPase subunit H
LLLSAYVPTHYHISCLVIWLSSVQILIEQNLLSLAPSQSLPSFFTNHTLELCESLKARKWSDEDVTEDLDYLVGELKGRLEGLTTYDEYVSELESGKLVWSPTHESEDFWRECAGRVGGDEGGKGIK